MYPDDDEEGEGEEDGIGEVEVDVLQETTIANVSPSQHANTEVQPDIHIISSKGAQVNLDMPDLMDLVKSAFRFRLEESNMSELWDFIYEITNA
ncbi:hypothetical protein JCGZ_14914 [Jatropha curcas]|uniref:Uncharacterized protein n=1 Tax=Jatropha curcas TaxID=180498 RepID=A0A067LC74_JATCU|nr:hypothetical protein JCGZ_14914 [Jatropha curcas]